MSALLSVRDLAVEFATVQGTVRAVQDVSFSLEPGSSLAVVGESGSGKSVTSRAILGLLAEGGQARGHIEFEGQNLVGLSERAFRKVRGDGIGMVFQDALDSLNPVYTVGSQLGELLRVRRRYSAAQAREQALRLMEQVGIPSPADRIDQYPHQFSGGMRQRICIALAIALDPRLLIADEPTTALDVTVQAGILRLLRQLREEIGMALIFVTHDLAVARLVADNIVVMHAGRVVERGPIDTVFERAQHPYTRALLAAHPANATSWRDLQPIPDDFVIDDGPALDAIELSVVEREDSTHGI